MATLPVDKKSLIIDTSGSQIFVGVSSGGQWLSMIKETASAVERFQALTNQCLAASDTRLCDIASIVYDRGPGSILGIRTVIAAIQSWRVMSDEVLEIYSFHSLHLIALQLKKKGISDFAILSDWKKSHWNVLKCSNNQLETIQTVELDELYELSSSGVSLYYLPQRKVWKELNLDITEVKLEPESVDEFLSEDNFLMKEDTLPGVYLPEAPSYKKWDQSRHT